MRDFFLPSWCAAWRYSSYHLMTLGPAPNACMVLIDHRASCATVAAREYIFTWTRSQCSKTSSHLRAWRTYDASLNRCVELDDARDGHCNGRNHTHCDESQLPLNGQRDNVGGKEQRNAIDKCVELLGDALIDPIAVCRTLVSATPQQRERRRSYSLQLELLWIHCRLCRSARFPF